MTDERIEFTGTFPPNIIAIKYKPGEAMKIAIDVHPKEGSMAELYAQLASLADTEGDFTVILDPEVEALEEDLPGTEP